MSSRTVRTGSTLEEVADASLPAGVPVPVFGAPIVIGSIEEVRGQARASPIYVPEARAWLVHVSDEEIEPTIGASDERLHPGIRAGLMALHQKCPHLGCRVPFCASSGWFECPCHGSKYTRLGEHRDGPGPRGLDGFPILIEGDVVSIASGELVVGRPIGTVTVDLPTTGPSCMEAAEH